jgi:predicted ATPase
MEQLDMNKLLNREKYIKEIQDVIKKFENNPEDYQRVGGIYIYGETGIGKTFFVKSILKDLGYDVINYDAGNIRNTSIIENIAKDKFSNKNIYHLLQKNIKKNVILMDEIDGMNNGDKGGINTLIKIIRPKKTKKQKTECTINSPVLCIGNCHIDKKIKELMKVCHVIYLEVPSDTQMKQIIMQVYPHMETQNVDYIIKYSRNNLRKLKYFLDIYKSNNELFQTFVKDHNIQMSSYSDDTKETVRKMFSNKYSIDTHNVIINDTDRTSVGLLWHENVVDLISKKYKNDKLKSIECYRKQLENICLSDYIDRITFQKQIWEFNEMSSLIKSYYNNMLFHDDNNNVNEISNVGSIKEIRFTKVLTKYSTEYNNLVFFNKLCQKLQLDKKDVIAFFCKIKDNEILNNEFITQLEDIYDVSKLEVERMIRYIDTLYIPTNDNKDANIDANNYKRLSSSSIE